MLQSIQKDIDARYDEMIDIRRYLHQYPELSFEETETAKYIAKHYENLQLPYETNIGGGNGVIATLTGGKPGKTVALRADFDALPIQEENDVPYKSKHDGIMHACGHDGHTATLLVLASVLKSYQEDIPGTILFVHQPAEELPPGGARPIVESGALDEVDAIFGNHLWATTDMGRVETRTGAFMAGTDQFEITVKGKGGHGAYPHETKDAIVIAAEIISKLQTIISRGLDPLQTAVITIGKMEAGNTFNVIAGKATLVGTVRYLDKAVQQQVRTKMKQVVDGICLANDAEADFQYNEGYPPLMNHPEETALIFDVAEEIAEVNQAVNVAPQMGGEDFSVYLEDKPGAFFFTGAKIPDHAYPHHHPKFNIDEKAMPTAAKMLIGAYLTYQSKAGF